MYGYTTIKHKYLYSGFFLVLNPVFPFTHEHTHTQISSMYSLYDWINNHIVCCFCKSWSIPRGLFSLNTSIHDLRNIVK